MALSLEGYDERVSEAVKRFWFVRENDGVRAGKTLDGFVDLFTWIVHNNGLTNAEIIQGDEAKLPGFFRPSKAWDVVVLNNGELIAAIELKSIADSFGKNFNNRTEEVLGSGIDLQTAFEENAFAGLSRLFTGYLILVEDCPETLKSRQIQMKYFKVMKEFMKNPEMFESDYSKQDNGFFPKIDGIGYMDRFDLMCKRLVQKQLYTSACVIKSPRTAINDGSYSKVSAETSIIVFLAELAAYISKVAALQD